MDKSPAAEPKVSGLPTRIGPYHVLDVLGEGGMGTVYLAELRQPVRRRVALKVIKLGMDTKVVLARFDAERQALSMMEHTNIARVYECGATDTGQPWFAMEHVKGIPITDYCDQNKLAIPERIALFKRVCAGMQHAHMKGVMHRDIKPSNVLVMLQDDAAIPKIIDFGLAKAVDHRLVEATLFTERGVVIGTPEYMSPEQAGLGGLDVDTRTDVYSLGVLLYELLTGDLPFRRDELRSAGILEMQRVIRETDPPKPSTRVTTQGDAGAEAARRRGMGRADLGKSLRGDLDWILMRALEKDPTRRYQTVLDLSADLGRYLKFEPVLASPPEISYRVRKFIRRFRFQVAAACVVLCALIAGAIATFVQYRRAEEAAKLAIERAADADRERAQAVVARRDAVEKEREATAKAKEADEERQKAKDERDRADEQRRLATQKELEATQRAREAEEQRSQVDKLNRQLKPWRISVAGPVQLAAAISHASDLDRQQEESLRRWLTEEAGPLLQLLPEIRETVAELRRKAAKVRDSDAAAGVTYKFAEADDQKLHDTLADLQQRIEVFEREQVAAVGEWLTWFARWATARAAIRAADDVSASELYGRRPCPDHPIDLRPHHDLVPMGMNPRTKLWEFAHLPSRASTLGAWTEARIAWYPDGAGALQQVGVTDRIVFVLIPGGRFWMGAEAQARSRNHDPAANSDEGPVHEVSLSPFFLARHELTTAQWERLQLSGSRLANPPPAHQDNARERTRPVANIDWKTADAVLRQHGLVLPTEAQWEYACRAGSDTPWSCASEDLHRHANLADTTARAVAPQWNCEAWSDGHANVAPVGSFLPNGFGLHDMHGNVWEWCADCYGSYGTRAGPGTGQRTGNQGTAERVRRGGGFSSAAQLARCATRSAAPQGSFSEFAGLRPARPLREQR